MSNEVSNEELLKRQMKRLFDEINYAQQRGDYLSWKGFIPWISQVIGHSVAIYPKNHLLLNIHQHPVPGIFDNLQHASANLTTIKFQLLYIMDILGIEFEEINKVNSFVPPVFKITQSQNSTQVNIQSLENINSIANNLSITPEKREEVKRLLEEYKKETEVKIPNESKIKSILSKVYTISKEVGIPLLNHATQAGYLTNLFNQ